MALETPRSLSPSKVSAFTDCPLAFRLSIIDRLPEAPSAAAVKGTLVHSALERLFWDNEKGARTPEAARQALAAAWQELQGDAEFVGLALDADEAAAFLADAQVLIDNYFALEDPNAVTTIAVELGLEVDLGTMRLRGIIDRLDLTDDGQLVVVDYKTGRAPSLRFEHGKLTGVHIYALLCQAVLGRAPVEVRLLHLRDPMSITAVPTEQSMRGQARRTTAVWNAIERACATEDFRPRPSSLCRFCSFQSLCPAFAGEAPLEAAS
jgi:putative RecB family exonuclease